MYDRAATAIDVLRTDLDLVEDDEHAVEEFARTEFVAADPALRTALIELLASELDGETDNLVTRRLSWYGRVFAGELAKSDIEVDWDSILKASPAGAALLFATPEVFNILGQRERRRVLSGIVGHTQKIKVPSVIGWRSLIPLLRANILNESEASRVREAQLRTPYPILAQAGTTLSELAPVLIEDLESGNFSSQNAAARWLLTSGNLSLSKAGLSGEDGVRIAYSLVRASARNAWGAQEATSRSRMADWSADILAGVLWMCLTGGKDRLDSSPDMLADLIAAITLAGKLEEVLGSIEGTDLIEGLSPISGESVDDDKRWLSHYGKELPDETQVRWNLFLTRLFARIPRKSPKLCVPRIRVST
jgi:hypothetical protein